MEDGRWNKKWKKMKLFQHLNHTSHPHTHTHTTTTTTTTITTNPHPKLAFTYVVALEGTLETEASALLAALQLLVAGQRDVVVVVVEREPQEETLDLVGVGEHLCVVFVWRESEREKEEMGGERKRGRQ